MLTNVYKQETERCGPRLARRTVGSRVVNMYALIASDSAALRSAASILLTSFEPEAEVLFASNISEILAHLRLGLVRTAVIDPHLPGYGQEFDAEQLAREYPSVRVSCLNPPVPRALASEPGESVQPSRATPLTGRQQDVLALLREGRSTKEIARRLDLAVPTVKTHLAALYRQLGVRNRVEAVMKQMNAAPRGHFAAMPMMDRPGSERFRLQTA